MQDALKKSPVDQRHSSAPQENEETPEGRFRFHKFSRQLWVGGYPLAIISALLAFVLRLSIDPWLGNKSPYITFIVAVAVTGLFAGVRPALVALALGAGIAYFCFIPPRYHWGFQGIGDAVAFAVYLLAGLGVVLLTHARRRAAEKARQALAAQIEVERKLLDAQSLFRLFMEHSTACAYLRDEHGNCVYANEAARREFGLIENGPGEAPVKAAFISTLDEQDQQVMKAGRAIESVDKTSTPDGERYWLSSRFPFVDQSGRRFFGGVSFEITSRIQAEEILRKTERLSAAGQMASILAHEVNNPLAALTNLIFLLNQQSLPAAAQKFASQADDTIKRINRIVAATLAFYFENDAAASLHVCGLIDEVLEMVSCVEAFSTIQVLREYACDPVIVASPPRMRQLIASLVTNSMESGAGRVRIRVQMGKDWRRGGLAGVRITVADDGRGVPKELGQKIFEPFVGTKMEKGTGLGLWVSRTMVLRNDGSIRLRSTAVGPKTGTCIRIFLPTSAEHRLFKLAPDVISRETWSHKAPGASR